MNIILDTHYFLWAVSDPDRIRPDIQLEIQTRANQVFVSPIYAHDYHLRLVSTREKLMVISPLQNPLPYLPQ